MSFPNAGLSHYARSPGQRRQNLCRSLAGFLISLKEMPGEDGYA
jgi:hypothetical protein